MSDPAPPEPVTALIAPHNVTLEGDALGAVWLRCSCAWTFNLGATPIVEAAWTAMREHRGDDE